MKINRSLPSLAAAAGLALAALGMTGAAQAQNINWSVGVSSPGVQLGFTNAQPIYIQQPMYQQVYVAPRPVYVVPQPIAYVRPQPVYVVQPQYVESGWQRPDRGYGWHRRHGHRDEQRFEGGRYEGERSGRGHRDHR
jgi:hypothetical protein